MLRLRGSQALSNFRIRKLLKEVQERIPSVQTIDTEFQHLVDLHDSEAELDSSEKNKLGKLLTYGPATQEVEYEGYRLFVLPRFGTISPWSTKATDIAHHCGLHKIARVERGVAFYINASSQLDAESLALLSALLHDPMTESVVSDLQQAESLFRRESPKALMAVSYTHLTLPTTPYV